MGGAGAGLLVGPPRGRVVRRMLSLLAAVAVAVGIGLAGDARPSPDGWGVVGGQYEDEAVPASAPTTDAPPVRVRYDELGAAPRVVPARLVVVRPHSIDRPLHLTESPEAAISAICRA